ncbi:hypothetical protein [Phaeodactylibacter luteus]|uniref:O-antigen polysaccharide polymerase Wzy n=1 Tax=Phaeodactylibacter luteus TaxID=1564516 RepID=A0A5C6RNK6_9BACT|nr:hypothetical protein [Phaeodactylibacter luteus]TXB63813.1 hypothetical protein FRY97_08330 [Phaeodactylibacter luteus]
MTTASIIGLTLVIWVFLRFVRVLGKSVPILELMLLTAGLQWIVGPVIEYLTPSFHYRYYMYVPEAEYMGYIVPAYAFFVLSTLGGLGSYGRLAIPVTQLQRYEQYGLGVFLIGVFFDLISGVLPGTLGFFAFLASNFKFVGAIVLFFSNDPRLRNIFYLALGYLFLSALRQAMFHDLVLWSVFFYMFWALKHQPSKSQIYLTILIGVLSLSTLQTIKAAYRMQVWQGYGGNKLELFADLALDAILSDDRNADQERDVENNVRLNQGWIISAIMDEIPARTPFIGGETIGQAISASILPRFLNPNKTQAGGRENFRRFTGLDISQGTSMGISIVGEAYGNYNVFGGILFMGAWGFFLARFWRFLLKNAGQNLLLIAFLPLIFLQVVKAETELVVVLNHMVKASIVVFGFFWAARNILNWKV